MKKILIPLILLAWVAGCSSSPPIPDWTLASYNRLESFKKTFMEGDRRIADLHFQNAVEEIKKSGDLDILAKAYLIRMAAEAAVLEKPRDDSFLKIDAAQPNPDHQNFHAFLTGPASGVKEQLLPQAYRSVAKSLQQGKADGLAAEIARIDDPFSRLIAAAVCIRQGHASEAVLKTAIDTASKNGWKKALLVYLERLHSFYEKQGQTDQAAAVSKRIDLIK